MGKRDARQHGSRVWSAALPVLILAACSADPGSPEAQVRALISRAEGAAQSKDIGTLKRLISERYSDERGQDRQALAGLLTYYFLRHQTIHLFTRVQTVEFSEPERANRVSTDPGSARTSVLVAMAGTPILVVDDLARLRADLYRFDFDLVREDDGEWRVARAAWSRATPGDFLP